MKYPLLHRKFSIKLETLFSLIKYDHSDLIHQLYEEIEKSFQESINDIKDHLHFIGLQDYTLKEIPLFYENDNYLFVSQIDLYIEDEFDIDKFEKSFLYKKVVQDYSSFIPYLKENRNHKNSDSVSFFGRFFTNSSAADRNDLNDKKFKMMCDALAYGLSETQKANMIEMIADIKEKYPQYNSAIPLIRYFAGTNEDKTIIDDITLMDIIALHEISSVNYHKSVINRILTKGIIQ
ncbi:MAG: hypothetical protein WC284_08500 [Candidimonas sp.]